MTILAQPAVGRFLWRAEIWSLLALLLATLSPIVSGSGQAAPLGRLLGVYDQGTGQPVVGAEVTDLTSGKSMTTSQSGAISLKFLQPGIALLRIRKVGYEAKLVPITTTVTDTVSVTVIIEPIAVQLPGALTTAAPDPGAKLSEFEDRQRLGVGHFITRQELEQNRDRQLADVMQSLLPSIRITRAKRASAAWATSSRGTQSFVRNCPKLDEFDVLSGAGCACYAAVYLDGALVYCGNDGESLFNVNDIRPDGVAAIEYYASSAQIPAKYSGTRTTCGLILIWTR
jgi:hypothetical protein